MSETNEMLEKPKLNLFQKVRKHLLLLNINYDKYQKAPDYLQNDVSVISTLVHREPSSILRFPTSKKEYILNAYIHLFYDITFEERLEIIEEIPTFATKLNPNEMKKLLDQKPQYLSVIDEETALEYLRQKQQIGAANGLIKFLREETQLKLLIRSARDGRQNNFADKLHCFSPNVVLQGLIQIEEMSKKKGNLTREENEEKNNAQYFKQKVIIENLPIDLQLKLVLLNEKYAELLSTEAAEKYMGDNPMLLKGLSTKNQIAMIKKYPEFFSVLDSNTKTLLLRTDLEIKELIPAKDKVHAFRTIGIDRSITDVEVLKNVIMDYGDNNYYQGQTNFTDYVREPARLIELARFKPEVLSIGALERFTGIRKLGHVKNLYNGLYQDSNISLSLDNLERRIIQMDISEGATLTTNLAKVLLNERVLANVSRNLIAEFIEKPQDRQILENIVSIAYGNQAVEILRDRPNIELADIPCLEIFDPMVMDAFGIGTVNNMLSYNSISSAVLGELVRHPDEFKKFLQFERIMEEGKDDVLGLSHKLVAYYSFRDLFKNADLSNLTNKQKQNLALMYNDRFMTLEANETRIIQPKTLEELETYDVRRNQMYDDYMKKKVDAISIKEAISRRFFGMQYAAGHYRFRQTGLSLSGMVNYYSLESFVSDERTVDSKMFSPDEIDMLELANIIHQIKDADVLREVYLNLSQRNDVLLPSDFSQTKAKIPNQYSKELVNSLLTVESAKERAQNGEAGISYTETEDGFEVIKLSGAEFKIMLHTTGLGNSGIREIEQDSDMAEVWKSFEGGCSTISACVIEPEMLYSCDYSDGRSINHINFGFSNIPEKQILGMSHHDAHVSHERNKIDPEFEYISVKFNYPDEFMRKTAAQITAVEQKDISHQYNEVAMYRRHADKTNSQYGERIMPDYIVVYGQATQQHKDMARKFSRDGKPIPIIEIDTEAYGNRIYLRGTLERKEDHSVDRKKGDIVTDIERITNERR